MARSSILSKQEHLSACVSRRFASPEQELAIQTTAGIIRDAVKEKGGHNPPRVPYRKNDDMRDKKIPYNKARWGTLGLSSVSEAQKKDHNLFSRMRRRRLSRHLRNPFFAYTVGKTVRGQSPAVTKQFEKAAAYKAKITSRKWRKAAGNR